VRAGLLIRVIRVAAASRGMLARRMSTDRIPASRGIASLADIPEGECRHGPPELVIRCKHSVIPVPVLARRRHEIGEPVEKLKRREVNDAVRPRSRGLAAATGSDPVGVNSVPFDIVIGKDGRLFSNSIGDIDAALVAESVQSEDDGRTKQ
jgi:hypothetical protein